MRYHNARADFRTFAVVGTWGLLMIGCFVIGCANPARAQSQPTDSQIIDALTPKAATRGLSLTRSLADPKTAEDRTFIDGLRNRPTRSLSIEEREKVSTIALEHPSIDLEINFDFNSATVGAQAVPVLLALGRALSNGQLKGSTFLLNGYTDAKGGFEYNQDLSERRADAVKRLLVQQFGLPADMLIAVGYGKTHLKNATEPFAAENRRVQVVNVLAQ